MSLHLICTDTTKCEKNYVTALQTMLIKSIGVKHCITSTGEMYNRPCINNMPKYNFFVKGC